MAEHMECPRAFLGKLVPEHFFFPLLRTALPERGPAPPPLRPMCSPGDPPPPFFGVVGGAPSRGLRAGAEVVFPRHLRPRVGMGRRVHRPLAPRGGGGGGAGAPGAAPAPSPLLTGAGAVAAAQAHGGRAQSASGASFGMVWGVGGGWGTQRANPGGPAAQRLSPSKLTCTRWATSGALVRYVQPPVHAGDQAPREPTLGPPCGTAPSFVCARGIPRPVGHRWGPRGAGHMGLTHTKTHRGRLWMA